MTPPHVGPSVEDLSAYHDGELPPEARASVAAHVASCATCAAALEGLAATSALLQALPRETASPELVARVARNATAGEPARGWTWALAIAATLFVAAFSLFVVLRSQQPPPETVAVADMRERNPAPQPAPPPAPSAVPMPAEPASPPPSAEGAAPAASVALDRDAKLALSKELQGAKTESGAGVAQREQPTRPAGNEIAQVTSGGARADEAPAFDQVAPRTAAKAAPAMPPALGGEERQKKDLESFSPMPPASAAQATGHLEAAEVPRPAAVEPPARALADRYSSSLGKPQEQAVTRTEALAPCDAPDGMPVPAWAPGQPSPDARLVLPGWVKLLRTGRPPAGSVDVELRIDRHGAVRDIDVAQRDERASALTAALRRVRPVPVRCGGVPVPVRVHVRFEPSPEGWTGSLEPNR